MLIFLSLLNLILLEDVTGQIRSTWPPNVDPDPNCLDYDQSRVPDCTEYIDAVTKEPYFIEHSYNCSRFWVCEPGNAPCLEECAPCGEGCGTLYFDGHYQYPYGPACNWPDAVDCTSGCNCESWQVCVGFECTPDCRTDHDCSSGYWCDASTELCKEGCRSADDCDSPCSECDDHACHDPECCEDRDCPSGQCVHSECVEDITTTTVATTAATDITTTGSVTTTTVQDTTTTIVQTTTTVIDTTTYVTDKPTSTTTPSRGCESTGCPGTTQVCDTPGYENCNYCDVTDGICKPGCGDNGNCPDVTPVCHDHQCEAYGGPGVTKITVVTADCQGCSEESREDGLRVFLLGDYGTECQSNSLDNAEVRDYTPGNTAIFDGEPELDGDDDGLGHCKDADLNLFVNGGSATWTGSGVWTGSASLPICVNFYDPDNVKPTCCCHLATLSLAAGESSDLVDCECTVI